LTFRECGVSFVDEQGTTRMAEVDAETVLEAAGLALKQWRMKRRPDPPRSVVLTVTQLPSREVYRVPMWRVLAWLQKRRPRDDAERERIARVRTLLADDRR